MAIEVVALAVANPGAELSLTKFKIPDLEADEVLIAVHFSGISRVDLDLCRRSVLGARFPMVPGCEIAGVVAKVGTNVTRCREGDAIGVGFLKNSCGVCNFCLAGFEGRCLQAKFTLGSPGSRLLHTSGGCSLPLQFAAPLLGAGTVICVHTVLTVGCVVAGALVWSIAMQYLWQNGGQRIGVVGLGGLGHIVVLMGKKMGNAVSVISRCSAKREVALELGADNFIGSEEGIKGLHGSLDVIIDSAPNSHNLDELMMSLKPYGTLIVVATCAVLTVSPSSLALSKCIRGTPSYRVEHLRQVLDWAAETDTRPSIQIIAGKEAVNESLRKIEQGVNSNRLVLDVKSTLGHFS
eukprot:Gregarina_sp_Poly_1__4456@NODE_239_length_10907_cov_182_631458_g210_i0_p5_GENE_NODE_239_length_10907_cov_182_631458_g210_i0NODE_239_length_10907_cov_182_631458_g210_i0_p5_ORF_typecomplete_len351_score27_10ADH_N/PF08240_12/1_6e19ADH_zinc_N/PF00107_26/8_5e03ADH_zinc_N/PF00107_26/6_2e11Glu_dehyd_C/PF16912_5/9_9e11ADH_zinc_N_2/PF13602_6/0_00162Hacid_dh_C/PF02826_19/0_0016NAD_binding_2/PF03446_15/0_0085NAD_binding_2/PF03446_15/4_7e03AlaDh_PNT_C/PF01262_21/0_093_NODE_239_length_10907_cov_182_631458_g2